MNAREINKKALEFLSKQNWEKAQQLFFFNAKKNPSHETYNNLGFYLVTEGLLCRNGKTRNALKLGTKYLLKAECKKTSIVNTCAIVKAIDYSLRDMPEDKEALYKRAGEYIKKALTESYSDVLQYNFLRFSYLTNQYNTNLISLTRDLVKRNPCTESASLYFELCRANNLIYEGLECIENYGIFLDDIELIMFYSKVGLYERGYSLCDGICKQYSIDEFVASAIIECCLNTDRLTEAEIYTNKIKEAENCTNFLNKEEWCGEVFGNLMKNDKHRKIRIDTYRSCPPLIDLCCYFGCSIHKTTWT